MDHEHARDRANEYAQLALSMMEDREIPPSPQNFTVWYHYFSGADPELKQTLNGLLDGDTPFTEDRNASVFARFFSDAENAPLCAIAQQMEAELGRMLAAIDQAGEGAAAYGKSLESAAGALAGGMPSERLTQLIAHLLNETRVVVEQGRQLEQKLQDSAKEIQELQGKLESSRKEALVDALTGLANRKRFDSALESSVQEATNSGGALSLLFLDVDHFKRFNDTYGHQVGDQVLKLLASILKKNIRKSDIAARYGGEEFSVILPGASLANALMLAERIRELIGARSLVERKTGSTLGQVTVSIGVAQFVLGEFPRQLVERADMALYEAKRTGRNRVVCDRQPHGRSTALVS